MDAEINATKNAIILICHPLVANTIPIQPSHILLYFYTVFCYSAVMIGEKFGRLTITAKGNKYMCVCDCGNKVAVLICNLRSGRTKSCGCLKVEMAGQQRRTHGMSQTSEYKIWAGIKKRCYNMSYKEYHLYGGRGINMSPEWKESFEAFYKDMGPRPSSNHSIERLDNSLGYNNQNCIWALPSQQTKNRRVSHFVTLDGSKIHLKEFANQLNVSYFTMYDWIVRRGASPETVIAKVNSR
jgi:hypothetical protein